MTRPDAMSETTSCDGSVFTDLMASRVRGAREGGGVSGAAADGGPGRGASRGKRARRQRRSRHLLGMLRYLEVDLLRGKRDLLTR